ncbi:MAG: replication initiator protein [Microvirus sp.]|nr:MAG: replication initiator protein [Microvirus sp.]
MACYARWSGLSSSGMQVRFAACGQCIGCRKEYARQWALRCTHEAQLHEKNCFLTLTYAKPCFSLVYRDFQIFIRALRRRAGRGIRFFMSGEYTKAGRPHFHACLFGFYPGDARFLRTTPSGFKLYTSQFLSKLWPHGYHSVGDVSTQSAGYVAKYVVKRFVGDDCKVTEIIDPDSGEIFKRVPEFARMSLRPGIGREWLRRFFTDVYPEGMCVIDGRKVRPPRYYDEIARKRDAGGYMVRAAERRLESAKRFSELFPDRLASREIVAVAGSSLFARPLGAFLT